MNEKTGLKMIALLALALVVALVKQGATFSIGVMLTLFIWIFDL